MAVGFVAAGLLGCADAITTSRDTRANGLQLMNTNQLPEAAGAFRGSVRQNPRDYQSHFYLAQCYERMGQYQQATASYRSALDVMSTTLEGREDKAFRQNVLNGLAQCIAKSDANGVETDAVAKSAQSRPTSENWFLLAKIHAFQGDADSALDCYNHAAMIDPQDFYVWKEYGLYLEKMNQGQRAYSPLKRAYSLNSQDVQVANALRRIGVVPGPSLKDESALAKPPVPQGPIPEVDWSKIGNNNQTAAKPAIAPSPTGGATVQTPRD